MLINSIELIQRIENLRKLHNFLFNFDEITQDLNF